MQTPRQISKPWRDHPAERGRIERRIAVSGMPVALLGGFQAMKAAEAARNGWWAEARERHAAGRATEACDDAAAAQDDRAQSIRDGLKQTMLAGLPGWTEEMVRELFA